MRVLVVVIGILAGLTTGIALANFGSPSSPQPISQNGEYDHFDVQVHNRGHPETGTWDDHMAAEHGDACQGPPATHDEYALNTAVYICNNHVMTSAFAFGYGEVVLTPSQLLDCTSACSTQFDISTARQSTRDWWELRLTPWADNLALPICGCLQIVDLQGFPNNGISISINNAESRPLTSVVNNGVATDIFQQEPAAFNKDIQAGTNQAAVRQTFKLTVTPGHVKFERLASATAVGIVFLDSDAAVQMLPDYIVQFEHHSYNPTKDGAGLPATWHWSGFTLTPSTPFTLIHASPTLVTQNNTLVQFNAPAPANAYLRFSAVCQVKIDGNVAPKMKYSGHPEHASSYFIPIAAGKQSVNVEMTDEGGGVACAAQDFHVWSKAGGVPSTPTPVASTPTPSPSPSATASPSPSSSSTPSPVPSATATLMPSPTSTALPTSTPNPTATPIRYCSTDGGNTIVKVQVPC